MSGFLEIGDRRLDFSDLQNLLIQYQLLPELIRAILTDKAIQNITLTSEEETSAQEQFLTQHQLADEQQLKGWLTFHRMTQEHLTVQAHRQFKIEKFKRATWQGNLEADFLQHKAQFEQFIYSLIRVENAELAQELFFRINEGECTFANLAAKYTKGDEANTKGLIGPVTAASIHPSLVQILAASQPGQLWPPRRLGNWFIIVRLESFFPAQLTNEVSQKLLDRRFRQWLNQQVGEIQVRCTAILGS